MRTILILCLSILFLPLTLAAEGLTVIGGEEGTDYSYADNVYTVLTGTALTFSGTTTTDRIVVKEGITANITLDKINIDNSSENAIKLEDGSTLTLTLSQDNKLAGGTSKAGINVPANTELIIQGEGELNVTGGRSNNGGGAGIGADQEGSTGSIIIKNGTIKSEALGGGGAGIGLGGWGGTKGSLTVEGGDLTLIGKGDEGAFAVSSFNITGGAFRDCTINDITVKGGNFTNCTFKGDITVKSGTYTDCTFNGNITLYNGTSSGYTTVDGSICSIYDGDWIFNEAKNYKAAIHSKKVFIYGGKINASGGSNCAGIGGNNTENGNEVTIYGGVVIAYGDLGAGIGGGDGLSWGGSGGKTTIYGGIIEGGNIGGGRSPDHHGTTIVYGGSIKSTISTQPTNGKDNVYRGITPEIENVTDVSVDGVPYYISENHSGNDNKLYLYMTGDKQHTVVIRTKENDAVKVYTYTTTFAESGVEGNTEKGYFSFGTVTETTPSNETTLQIDKNSYTSTYSKEEEKLTVTLTVTDNKIVNTRSAAMNSVQLILKDETTTYYSDRQTVTTSGNYTFTFDIKDLNAGSYTLQADYGGSTTSLPTSDKQEATLTIEKAEGSDADDYLEPSSLTATYGQQLSDVTLPTGWAWDAPKTSIGAVSSPANSFAATFTPGDAKNYTTVLKSFSVTVKKAPATNPEEPAVTSSSSIIYGTKLSDITITDSWQWKDGTIIPTVNNYYGYWAYFSIDDETNYDWSKIKGYNGTTHRVERRVSVSINKADLSAVDFTFTTPSDLVYNGSAKAATVTAKDGLTDISSITIQYYKENVAIATDPIEVGNYTVKINVDGGNNYNDVTDLEVGKFSIIPKQYAIAIDPAIANGTVTADKTQTIEGETVTLTVTPAQGYEQETLSYTTDGGTTVAITGTTFVMPAADVTVTATFKASSVPPVNPPVIPDDPDDPAPVRYTVTLPTVEGAATDPAAGSYEVESWGNFSFLLTLGEGYQKDSHPVVTARGETLTPNASTGKYIIPNVQSDITVGITGIVKDVATGNESLTDGFHITISGGLLLITVPRATRLYLTDTSGRLILSRLLPAGDTRIDDLAAGVYLLTLEGEKTKKIIIR